MTALATVVVPTHDHSTTLPHAVGSALRQSLTDLEVVIIGDGADNPTRRAATALCDLDDRVRFIERPKAPRYGEAHRHGVLQELDTPFVLYLSDDDLWLPEHAAQMVALLDAGVDAASARFLVVTGTTALRILSVDLGTKAHRDLLAAGPNAVGLSGMAHRLDSYRRLPHGWRTTPEGTPTDLHMWRQWLEQPWATFASCPAVTVVNLPSSHQPGQSTAEREVELLRYVEATRDEGERRALFDQALIDEFPRQSWMETQYASFTQALDWHKQTMATVDRELQWHIRTLAAAESALEWHRGELHRIQGELRERAGEPVSGGEP